MVAAHLMGAEDEVTSEGEDSQYDLPKPIAPPTEQVQNLSLLFKRIEHPV